MPTYDYECPKCESSFERVLPLAQYRDPQTCETCGEIATKVMSPVNFVLKGDNWASKANRISGQMAQKNRKLDAKQAERKRSMPGVTLVPNVNGERVGSWSEAQKLAASKGKNAESYAPKVRKEQAKQ
jgi:putative FmdB family regulatory protein